MPTTDELEQEIRDLREELNNTRDGLNQSLQLRTEETEEELLRLSHQMRMGVSQTNDSDDEDTDIRYHEKQERNYLYTPPLLGNE